MMGLHSKVLKGDLFPGLPLRRWIQLTGSLWAVTTMLMTLPMLIASFQFDGQLAIWFPLIMLSGILLSILLSAFVLRAARWHWAKQWPAMIAAVVVAAFVQSTIDHVLWLLIGWSEALWATPFVDSVGSNFLVYIWIFALYAALLELLLLLQHARLRDQEIARARAATGRAELAALRYQIQPDVLFTTLSSTIEMVEAGREADASALVDRLSGFMRDQLAADTESGSTIGDELEALDDYLALERARTEMIVDLDTSCLPDVAALPGPTFLLQPAVEARLQHAERQGHASLKIDIAVRRELDRLVIEVADDAPPQDRKDFAGLLERLDLLGGGEASLQIGEKASRFTLRIDLPLG